MPVSTASDVGELVFNSQIKNRGIASFVFSILKCLLFQRHSLRGILSFSCLLLTMRVTPLLVSEVYVRTESSSGTGLACPWCACGNSRSCMEQLRSTALCLFLWSVTADQSRKRWGVWFSAHVNAAAVWLANGFCLVAQMWPEKEASAVFAWPKMLFQPTSAQRHACFAYLLASAFRNHHARISCISSIIVNVRGVTFLQKWDFPHHFRVLCYSSQHKDNWHFTRVEGKFVIFCNFGGQMSFSLRGS